MRSSIGGNRGGCIQVNADHATENDKTLIFESRFESGNLGRAVQVLDMTR